jgi:hypothetical protein
MDGYEADTDDTLQRRSRRKSVKELAGMFQRAENACPSPIPFRCQTESNVSLVCQEARLGLRDLGSCN